MAHIKREEFQARKTVRTSLLNGQGSMYAITYGNMKYDLDWDKTSAS